MVRNSSAATRKHTPHVSQTIVNADKHLSEITAVNKHDGVAEEEDHSRAKIEALAEMICCNGEEPTAALFVMMGHFENSADPRACANTVKHFAFTRCGELNLNGMVDAQISVVENELLAGSRLPN